MEPMCVRLMPQSERKENIFCTIEDMPKNRAPRPPQYRGCENHPRVRRRRTHCCVCCFLWDLQPSMYVCACFRSRGMYLGGRRLHLRSPGRQAGLFGCERGGRQRRARGGATSIGDAAFGEGVAGKLGRRRITRRPWLRMVCSCRCRAINLASFHFVRRLWLGLSVALGNGGQEESLSSCPVELRERADG